MAVRMLSVLTAILFSSTPKTTSGLATISTFGRLITRLQTALAQPLPKRLKDQDVLRFFEVIKSRRDRTMFMLRLRCVLMRACIIILCQLMAKNDTSWFLEDNSW